MTIAQLSIDNRIEIVSILSHPPFRPFLQFTIDETTITDNIEQNDRLSS